MISFLTKIFPKKKLELNREDSSRISQLSGKISDTNFYELSKNEQAEYLKLSAKDFNGKFKKVIEALANE